MDSLGAQQSLLLEYKARPDQEATDDGENNANDLIRAKCIRVGCGAFQPARLGLTFRLLPAEIVPEADEVAAAAVPVIVADAEEDMIAV